MATQAPALAQEPSAHEVLMLESAPFAEQIGERQVSFSAHDLETGTHYILEGSDLDERRAPWSTFKIPNFLIALETGVIDDVNTVTQWDQTRRPAQNWWPDAWQREQSLRTAFQRSAVWFFSDIALEIETQTYRDILADWNYGANDIAEGSDVFWLSQGLEISVNEQVAFLEQLYRQQLVINGEPVSQSSIEALYEASLAQQIGEIALHGKTGSGTVIPGDFSGPFEGWYVGFVERENALPVVFALYTVGPDFRSIRTFRQEFATQLLIEAELLPAAFGE